MLILIFISFGAKFMYPIFTQVTILQGDFLYPKECILYRDTLRAKII